MLVCSVVCLFFRNRTLLRLYRRVVTYKGGEIATFKSNLQRTKLEWKLTSQGVNEAFDNVFGRLNQGISCLSIT